MKIEEIYLGNGIYKNVYHTSSGNEIEFTLDDIEKMIEEKIESLGHKIKKYAPVYYDGEFDGLKVYVNFNFPKEKGEK